MKKPIKIVVEDNNVIAVIPSNYDVFEHKYTESELKIKIRQVKTVKDLSASTLKFYKELEEALTKIQIYTTVRNKNGHN